MNLAARLTFGSAFCLAGLALAADSTAPLQRPTRPGAVPQGASSPSGSVTRSESASVSPPAKVLPSRSARIGGVEYLPLSDWAAPFALKTKWEPSSKEIVLFNQSVRVEMELDSRQVEMLGVRLFLGEAVRLHKGTPHVPRIDAERLLAPILRPGIGQARIPPLQTIVLDAGHGGKDTGKVNERLRAKEKEYTLDTALRTKKLLEREGYKVVLTRSDDRYIELPERAAIAERAKAHLFISIHFNSVENGASKVTGVETYTMTPQHQLSSDRAPDQYVTVPNPGNAQDHWNSLLGFQVHRQVLRELKASDRGLKRGRLAVLRLAPCPAVLVEGGYLSQDAEARKIMTSQYRQTLAEGIVGGVRSYAIALEGARRLRGR